MHVYGFQFASQSFCQFIHTSINLSFKINSEERFSRNKGHMQEINIASLVYCKTLNICGIKFLRFTENDILAHFNFDHSLYNR